MNKRLIANVIGCIGLTLATAAEARTSYDGPWILVFVTQSGKPRPDLQFLCEYKRRRCDAPQSGEVLWACRKIRRGSCVGDGPRQIRIRVREADARRRSRNLERPRRRWALLGILDRATKQLGRNHRDARRRPRQGRTVHSDELARMGMPRRTTPHPNAPPICRDGFITTIGTALMAV